MVGKEVFAANGVADIVLYFHIHQLCRKLFIIVYVLVLVFELVGRWLFGKGNYSVHLTFCISELPAIYTLRQFSYPTSDGK